ncbi:MAG: DUF445 family protein [Clostridiaceae bacterium]|nr:DUF445 family protein [Clostridiaceae bacterium]
MVINAFDNIVYKNLSQVLSAIDIPAIVEKRINEYDLAELEQLILDVAGKELKAIVWLGAFLGFLMGFLPPLFT